MSLHMRRCGVILFDVGLRVDAMFYLTKICEWDARKHYSHMYSPPSRLVEHIAYLGQVRGT